ncbi:uncharacterized protein LOC128867306 [Anastrepha ludens]|uniref:uncharacterized protein LOC128867306 n=1 Tax=Anastrepha ludens TaxID=28586 RepID=UPI0023B08837|nr:uncharacterized protein LOC128867306 [Anastrepha ludens]
MWLIFLIWSFGASTVASLYTPRCSNSGPPVCATNGQEYLYFGNECKLNAYIYQQQFQEKPIPVRTDMDNCLFHCYEIVCPSVYKPVCVQQVPAGPITTVAHPCLVNRLICETKQHWKIISEGPCIPDYSFSSATAQDYQTYDLSSAPYDGSAQAQLPTPPSYGSQGQDYDVAALIPLLGNAPSPSWYGVQETDYAVPAPASIYDLNPAPAPYDGSAQTQTPTPVSYAAQGQDYKAPDPAPTLYAAPPTSAYGDQGKDYAAPAPASIYDLNPAPTPCDGSAQTQTPALVSYAAQDQDYKAPDPAPTLYAAPPTSAYGDQGKDYAAPAPASIYDLNPAPTPCDGSAQTQTPALVSYAAQDQDYKAPDPAPILYNVPNWNTAPRPFSYAGQSQTCTASAAAPLINSVADQSPISPPYSYGVIGQSNEVPAAPAPAPVSYSGSDQYAAPSPFSYIIPLETAKSAAYSDPNQYQVPAPSHFVEPLPFAAPDKSSYPSLPYYKSPLQPDPVSASYSVPYPFAAPQQASDANMQSTPTPNPYVAPIPDFADYLRGKLGRYPDPVFDNSYSELATALNIARLFRWLRLPFGPIYYRPNYIHIIYNED